MEFTQQEFWQAYPRFQKANLVTEAPNPLSHNLSQLCQTNLTQAFAIFKIIELEAINNLKQYIPDIQYLETSISRCISDNNKVFLVGCGASGRLAMLLKCLWESYNPQKAKMVVCVAAAGDTSLVRSVEQFEDKPEFGIKQLLQQGFTSNDLLIGLSASGESPFILSAVEYALAHSQYKPFLIFNNSKSSLLERHNSHILTQVNTLALDVGPMALTGSTRLQATTAMHIAVGIALCKPNTNISHELDQIVNIISSIDLNQLSQITHHEADLLQKNEYILYQTNNQILGLSILADTTERAPTFNLTPYENNPESIFSPFYLSIKNTHSASEAWRFLLGDDPNCLNWPDFEATSTQYIQRFDLSSTGLRTQGVYLPKTQHITTWLINKDNLKIHLVNQTACFDLPVDLLYRSLIYKTCLNSHSTLMMGRVGYFFGNMMVSLKPSNFKLVDRAIRYSQFILKHSHKLDLDYKIVANTAFDEIDKLKPNQSIVENIVHQILTH